MDFEGSCDLELSRVGADVWTRSAYPTVLSFAINDDPIDTIVFDQVFRRLTTTKARERLGVVWLPDTEIHAWNAGFEFLFWNNACAPRHNWPALPIERFYCTMAQAALAGLPMSLDQASQAVETGHRKDMAGARNMKRLARPRRDGTPQEWWHLSTDKIARENAEQLIAYNRADVEAERALHHAMPAMSAKERRLWLIDQKMQMAGLPVDRRLLDRLTRITVDETDWLNSQLAALTEGMVETFTQHAKILNFLRARGFRNPNMAKGKDSATDTLAREPLQAYTRSKEFRRLPYEAQEVIRLRLEAAKTSTAKLNSMREFSQVDGAARHLSQYGGAVRTLRWAGRGVQIQNFPRPLFKEVNQAIDAILAGADGQALSLIWGRPLDVVSSCLRGVFCAPEGKRFVVCDYGQIEARVVAWLALHGVMLQVFARDEDIYVFMAAQQNSTDRQFGKVLTLACGYGMGPAKFVDTAAKYGIDLEFNLADLAVQNWRSANWPIVSAWHACEQQAHRAILRPGEHFRVNGKLTFRMARPQGKLAGALLMVLPSGRHLVYRNARIEAGDIVYDGVNQYTRKWETIKTYGGKLIENATQAVARDLLADALLDLDQIGRGSVLRQTVHDEIIAIVDAGDAQDLKFRMEWVMTHPPSWAAGLPIAVTGSISRRYGKV
jgi:DNA polymerase